MKHPLRQYETEELRNELRARHLVDYEKAEVKKIEEQILVLKNELEEAYGRLKKAQEDLDRS